MEEIQYYCKTCKKGYEKSKWKTHTITHESIVGGSYEMLISCPKGHSN